MTVDYTFPVSAHLSYAKTVFPAALLKTVGRVSMGDTAVNFVLNKRHSIDSLKIKSLTNRQKQ